MSAETEPVPPVPQHTPPVNKRDPSERFENNWMQWFLQLRDKINIINTLIVNLSNFTGSGFAVISASTDWFTRTLTEGTAITITNADGTAGNPTISHGDTSTVADLTSNNSNIVVIQDVTLTFDTFGHVLSASVGTVDLSTALITQSITNGDTTHAPSGDAVFDALAFSGALVAMSGNQSINNATSTTIIFDSETYDTDAYHDNATNPTRLTIPSNGTYLATANITFNTNTTGIRQLEIIKNGSGFIGMANIRVTPVSGFPTILNISTGALSLASGDYLEVRAFQDSGGALNVLSGNTSSFSVYRITSDIP